MQSSDVEASRLPSGLHAHEAQGLTLVHFSAQRKHFLLDSVVLVARSKIDGSYLVTHWTYYCSLTKTA